MEQSILKSTKELLGIDPENTDFDLEILTRINSAFSTIHGLGVGPDSGFAIEDEGPVWDDFLAGDVVQIGHVKTIVWGRVRLAFDPPQQAFLIEAIKEQIKESEWRLNVNREDVEWTDPDPDEDEDVELEDHVILEGGDADPDD